jgi:AraC-like DNA-binding protein
VTAPKPSGIVLAPNRRSGADSASAGSAGSSKSEVLPASGLVVFESRHAPGFFDQIQADHATFLLVISGQARCEGEGWSRLLGPDTLFHIPAGQPLLRKGLANVPVGEYVIHYQIDLLRPAHYDRLAGLGMLSLDLRNANQAHTVRSIFQEMLFEQDAGQEGWEMVLHCRLIDLAVYALRTARRQRPEDLPRFQSGQASAERVAQYALRLRTGFCVQESLSEAARTAGLSRRQFTELFRKTTGQSWRQYVVGVRLKHAAKLLIETDKAVMAVAFECGFDDLSHFYHSFKTAHGCSPAVYRERGQVRLPSQARPFPEPLSAGQAEPGFKFRGIKGWCWRPEQYLEEIPWLPKFSMNFLMNCYGSLFSSEAGSPRRNEWWKPLPEPKQKAYARIVQACREQGITYCFAMHPQLGSPRPLDAASAEDFEPLWRHYAWAQDQGVRWFCLALDDVYYPELTLNHAVRIDAREHAQLVNKLLDRLRRNDPQASFIFCPTWYSGWGTDARCHSYLETIGRELHPEVYLFWIGDAGIALSIQTKVTRAAAESYRAIVRHRLFLWDNYPVNDGHPTLHLGPLSGRDPDLCEVIDGYISNPMASQNQINRLPLATCADYAYNPSAYDPARSIGQAIQQLAETTAQREVLKHLVEAYPGFIVAGGSTGTNPVRQKFHRLLAVPAPQRAAHEFLSHMEAVAARLEQEFPGQFAATKQTVTDDLAWMRRQFAGSG